MSVVGFDVGNLSCYTALARQGGIETIANEYSDRNTPCVVSLTDKERAIGSAAKSQMVSNYKNTIFSFKHFMGRTYDDPLVQREKQWMPYEIVPTDSRRVGVKVRYMGVEKVFAVEQVMSMLFTKLKSITEMNLKKPVQDCVISVPTYYTDAERRALLDSAAISGLNCLRLFNDTTAVALAYGIYKQDLPAVGETPRNVFFVDMGHSALQVAAVSFQKGKLKVLATAFDARLGGQHFDRVIWEHFAEDFKKRYGIDVRTNKRAGIRLLTECEKIKKHMSVNSSELHLNIECLMDDKDVHGKMKREMFEQLSASLIAAVDAPLQKALSDSGLKKEEIYAVEIIGGSTRIPAVKSKIQTVFGREPSTTLNVDEAVSRGCALQCAMLSPTFKVRDFSVQDSCPYSVSLRWNAPVEEETSTEIFPLHHAAPFSKMLTFYRKEAFELEASYSDSAAVNFPESKIGSFRINKVVPKADGESSKVKVKVRMNIHGVFTIKQASLVEKVVVVDPPKAQEGAAKVNGQEPMETDTTPAAAEDKTDMKADVSQEKDEMETDQNEAGQQETEKAEEGDKNGEETKNAQEEKADKKVKNKVKLVDLPVDEMLVMQYSLDELNGMMEKENELIMNDKLEREKADSRNAVEEYVYDMREKISDKLYDYVTDEERKQIMTLLEDTENWLYEDGENETKSVYVKKLEDLRKIGDPVMRKYVEDMHRPAAFEQLGASLMHVTKFLQLWNEKDEKYDHISEEEVAKVNKAHQDISEWYNESLQKQSNVVKHQDPAVTIADIQSKAKELEKICTPVINKKRPKPKEEPPATPDQTETNQESTEEKQEQADTGIQKLPTDDGHETKGGDGPSQEKSKEDMDLD